MSKVRSLSGAPLFCNFPAEVTASGFFYSRCSGLIFKDLPTFWKNGEFSVFAFRDTKTADLPPNSPFALCRGHTDFKSHNRVQRSNLRKIPLFRFGFSRGWSSSIICSERRISPIFVDYQYFTINPPDSDLTRYAHAFIIIPVSSGRQPHNRRHIA